MILSRHHNPLADCELRFEGDNARTFSGYASVWDSVDSYGDTVQRGAFEKSLASGRTVRMFYNHDPSRPIGIWTRMVEDDRGLAVTGELTPGNSDAENVYASMKHGAIDGLSIGFRTEDAEERDDGGRVLKRVELVEVSAVTLPAERNALVTSVKTFIEQIDSIRDVEHLLRDAAGFSASEAKALVSQFRSVLLRDAAAETEAKIEALGRQLRTADLAQAIRSLSI